MSQKKKQPTTPLTPDTFLDTNVPNMARIFDYLTGGSAHFEADRRAAAEMLAFIPSLKKWVRLRRAFIQEAVHKLYQQGVRQFLDLGSGMPTTDHFHTVAPDAHIIYSDINPIAVSYGNSLFSDNPNVVYIHGDARQFDEIVSHNTVRHLINPREPVAIGLNALILFLSPAENRTLARMIYEWAPTGSQIFVVLQTRGDIQKPEGYTKFLSLTKRAGLPMQLYSLKDTIDMLAPWRLAQLEPITQFLGLPRDFITEADREGIGMAFFASFFSKDSV